MTNSFTLGRLWARLASPDRQGDDGLMARAALGETDAYGMLVRRYQAAVRSYCVRLSGSRSVGDDLAQEVFLTVWQARAKYEGRGRFRFYLFTVARNVCQNHARVRRDKLMLTAEPPELATDADALSEMVVSERRRRLHALVLTLPKVQKDAIVLRFTADLEYAEIAEIVGKSEATVRSRVFLGLARLRRALSKVNR